MKQSIFLLSICYFFSVVHTNMIDRSNYRPSSANTGSVWTLGSRLEPLINHNTTKIQVILSTNRSECSKSDSFSSFHLGFYGDYGDSRAGPTFVLAIFMVEIDSEFINTKPVVVWWAKEGILYDVGETLILSADQGLELQDHEGNYIWSGDADNLGNVSSMKLTCHGNLVLENENRDIIWESFDHPTDTWVPGQSLGFGQKLTSRTSSHNWQTGICYLSIGNDFHAFVDTDPAIEYGYFYLSHVNHVVPSLSYTDVQSSYTNMFGVLNMSYIRLDPSGQLNVYTYNKSEILIGDLLSLPSYEGGGSCKYPFICGSYGICYGDHTCGCPSGNLNYFEPSDVSAPQLGCQHVKNLSCSSDAQKHQTFLEVGSVTYFAFESYLEPGINDIDSCKTACLKMCSCQAALFQYAFDLSSGNCSLPSQLLTLIYIKPISQYDVAYIKVQNKFGDENKWLIRKLVPFGLGGLFLIALSTGVCYYVLKQRNNKKNTECPPDILINTVTRFSFDFLRLATNDFQKRLGRGGFGAVFEGTLEDGTKVAVKRLHSVGQTRKEFLAEVNTIGNFHHYNLVRLIGFCDSGSNRLLVYEYMPNGSLDKWIFNKGLAPSLPWHLRQSIIGGIAKGLEYLHENCLHNVIHFDIKPQNILLDEDFNAKIADFGLAKMVDRDQSQIVTIIRGTPGYIAPELITAQVISVKLDVYSFGVLVLEIVCGRKNFGSSNDELLINLVKIKLAEDQISDLIDGRTEDMQQHKEEAVKMIKVAMWCLQPHIIRPSMSMVVKTL